MTDLTPEQWQAQAAAIRRFAQAFGETITNAARKLSAAIAQCAVVMRRFAVAVSVALVRSHVPQANVERLTRHLSRVSDPCGRAQYMMQQARRGHVAPMLR